jgi:hypothetical protein
MPPLEELGNLYVATNCLVAKAGPSAVLDLCCSNCPTLRAKQSYERPNRSASGAGLSVTLAET